MFFKYKAVKDNTIIVKKIQAESEQAVVSYLKNNGYIPVSVTSLSNNQFDFIKSSFDKTNFSDLVDFTRQMAIMLNAGLTIVEVLEIIRKQTEKKSMLKLVEDIDKHVKGGNSLSSALAQYPQYFSNLYIALVKAGEASGKLSDILLKLSETLEKEREFKSKLKGALVYPVIVVIAMMVVMFIMVTFVLPRLLDLYKDFNIDLPFTTKVLIAVSSFSRNFWPLIILGAIGGYYLLRRYFKTRIGKYNLDATLLKLPIISNVVKMAALVDATRTLSILVGSGVSMLDTLQIVVSATDNYVYQVAFQEIYKKVEKGQSLGNSFAQAGIFPPILVQMAIVGENTGHLDETLGRLSKYFESESELAIKAMTTLIEPAILVFLGVGVGFLVLSVITPIYNLTSSF